MAEETKERHVGPVLAAAIVALPLLFYWILLRRGYARSTRRAAAAYLVASLVPGIVRAMDCWGGCR